MLLDNTLAAAFTISSVPNDEAKRLTRPARGCCRSADRPWTGCAPSYPFFRSEIIPAGVYRGQDRPMQTLGRRRPARAGGSR